MLFQFFFLKENQARSQAKIPEGAKPSPQDRATTMARFYTLTVIGCKAKRQTEPAEGAVAPSAPARLRPEENSE